MDPNHSIAIFYDWKSENIQGKGYYFKQNLVGNGHNPYSLFIRQRCYERGLIASKGLKGIHSHVVLNRGLNLAEYISDTQCIRNAKLSYYIPICGSIYFTGIGVAQTLTDTTYYKEEEIIKLHYFIENFTKRKKDEYWLKALLYKTYFLMNKRPVDFIKTLYYYVLGLECYDMNVKSAKRFWSFVKKI